MRKATMTKEEFCWELAERLKPTFTFYVARHMEHGYTFEEAKNKFLEKIEEAFGTYQAN